MPEPQWLDRDLVDALHEQSLRLHGGLAGVRDASVLEAAQAAGITGYAQWPAGELGGDCQGSHPAQGGASLPRDQAAVRLSEDQAARHDQESVQGECAGRTDKSVPCKTSVARWNMNGEVVCPFGIDWSLRGGRSGPRAMKSEQIVAHIHQECLSRTFGSSQELQQSCCPEVP